jgi:hypothetical protein
LVKHERKRDFGMSILITNVVGTNANRRKTIGKKADRTNVRTNDVKAIVIGTNFVREKAFRTNASRSNAVRTVVVGTNFERKMLCCCNKNR